MRKKLARIGSITGVLAALAGCESPPAMGPSDETFGNAVQSNIAAQVVNPDPQPEAGPPPLNGNRAAIAMQRYQTDKVKQPQPLSTSSINIITGGGAGGQ